MKYCKTIKLILFAIVSVLMMGVAEGAYIVEIDDDTYVSDEVYFAPMSTWDEVKADKINLKCGKVVFYVDKPNELYKIEASVMPVNTTNKNIEYKSEDISIATVDENGVVTPKSKIGNTVIDIKCGNAVAKLKVQVVKAVRGLELSQKEMTLYADKPVTAQLTADVMPADATVKEVKWYSEDKAVASVDKNGLVMPCGVGETYVCAESDDGGYVAKCKVNVTTWEKRKNEMKVTYKDYDMSLDEMIDKQMTASPTTFENAVMPASREDVEQYVNPSNLMTGYERYQFMDLSVSNNVSAETLDEYLKGKGVLDGKGSVFKNSADKYGLSEVYLVIHSCLETGNGTSELSSGVEYNGVTVYNMFGIGAVDASPVDLGAEYAYQQGWTSIEKAISGGARWISENYINNEKYEQNTLYKMRWNPEKPSNHQYATDVAWASKQARDMSGMFESFPTAEYKLEIPSFKN